MLSNPGFMYKIGRPYLSQPFLYILPLLLSSPFTSDAVIKCGLYSEMSEELQSTMTG